jgi:hypothetical protein
MQEDNTKGIEREIDELVDELRSSCLWYLRPDYYPANDRQRDRVLERIQRHGDRAAFQRAAGLRKWLSLPSSGRSAVS